MMTINDGWTLSFTSPVDGKSLTIPARVPGNVLGDLQRAGIIDDPYWDCNSDRLRPWEYVDWIYSCVFDAPEIQPGEKAELRFDGIDTIARIFLNGNLVGESCDMFVESVYDVTPWMLPGKSNALRVEIQSSLNYARQFRHAIGEMCGPYQYESLCLRRARHTYGWDIAPRLVGAGLWRNVGIEVLRTIRWTDVFLFTLKIEDGKAAMLLDWSFETDTATLEGYEARLSMRCGDSVHEEKFPLRFVNGVLYFDFENPRLWWPRDTGGQSLYDVSLELIHDGCCVDCRKFRMGVRDIELKRTDALDEHGMGEFRFIVNNVPVFVKGSNWVPIDALHGEHPERMRKDLELFAELGCNMVRCWGGNVYEDEDFFNACDELGIMVWQDFAFACEVEPRDQRYLDIVRREAELVIRRLRQHPSMALWCGNNENDEMLYYNYLHKRHTTSYSVISREVLRRVVEELDPSHDYLPSSPYLDENLCRKPFFVPTERHLWGPRDNHKSKFYKENKAVFVSEIGYHGMPCESSLRRFLPEGSLNGRIGNPGWNCHASQPFGDLNGPYSYRTKLMLDQVDGCFGEVPEDLHGLIVASQVVQAEAVKYFIELFRQRKWSKSGIIWWNMIDCWPQFSDAVVDYYYAKKLAFYYIRTAQQPFLISCEEPESWNIRLMASNDTLVKQTGTYRVTELMSGNELASGSFAVDANCSAPLQSMRVSQGRPQMLLIRWEMQGRSCFNHYALNFPPMSLGLYREWLDKLVTEVYGMDMKSLF